MSNPEEEFNLLNLDSPSKSNFYNKVIPNLPHSLNDLLEKAKNVESKLDTNKKGANETGFENLKELAAIQKKCTAEDILEFARILRFENDLYKKYRTYSTGMKQKLRLIQALMEKPKYLLLDEPFDGLDTEAKNIVKKLLEDYLSIEGNTLIFTNHEEDIALENETVYVIRDHQILTE
jgi:ABC-type multidrug transport system ATPase subunit